jgi:hypothetical protein
MLAPPSPRQRKFVYYTGHGLYGQSGAHERPGGQHDNYGEVRNIDKGMHLEDKHFLSRSKPQTIFLKTATGGGWRRVLVGHM